MPSNLPLETPASRKTSAARNMWTERVKVPPLLSHHGLRGKVEMGLLGLRLEIHGPVGPAHEKSALGHH